MRDHVLPTVPSPGDAGRSQQARGLEGRLPGAGALQTLQILYSAKSRMMQDTSRRIKTWPFKTFFNTFQDVSRRNKKHMELIEPRTCTANHAPRRREPMLSSWSSTHSTHPRQFGCLIFRLFPCFLPLLAMFCDHLGRKSSSRMT